MNIIPLVMIVTGSPLEPRWVLPGDRLEINDEEANRLIERQHAVLASNEALTTAPQSDHIAAIVDAIAELPSQSYGKDGKPSVKAIQSIIDVDITATQRDEAWQHFQLLSQT